jgi:hypothetical protein
MSDNASPPRLIPPGWYPDPANPTGKRWWDGRAWTADVQAAGAPQFPPFGTPVSPVRAEPAYVPMQTSRAYAAATPSGIAYTRSVWWICAFPLWGLVSQVMIVSLFSVFGNPPILQLALGLTVLSLVFLAILVRLAFADRAGLLMGGNNSAASGWWMLLSPLAYLIARALEVRRWEAGGWTPVVWWSVAAFLSPGIAVLAYFAVFGLIGA